MKLKLKNYALTLFLCLSGPLSASEIFVADLQPYKKFFKVSNIKNITNRAGYDNQPYFSVSGQGLYFTSMFEVADKQQTDIMYYSFADQSTSNLTNSPNTSEYSPTPYNGDNQLSVIKVEESGSQRLWSVDVKTGQQTILNSDIEPVGYHAWGRLKEMALFVLGAPMTLQYIKKPDQTDGEWVANDIGRTIQYNLDKRLFSFTQGKEQQVFSIFKPASKETKKLITLPKDSEYYSWLGKDKVIAASGSEILVWVYKEDGIDHFSNWLPLANVIKYCPTKVTRLAVDKKVTKLAFVCED